MDHLPPAFFAKIKFLSTEEGGRRGPVTNGYRPHIEFSFSEEMTSAHHQFEHEEWVYPGMEERVRITLLHPDFYFGKLREGTHFLMREGHRIISKGQIEEILIDDLRKS